MIEHMPKEERAAVLAGVCLGKEREFQISMEELRGLAKACGYAPASIVIQNLKREDPATLMGSGKLEEIKNELWLTGAETVLFQNALSPSQLSNLAKELEAEVLDKTGLILEIFGERARSAEARMQVEYARLQYMLPRLVGLRQNLSRQGGTGGSMSNKGSGEKQIELDRRHIEKRMAELRKGLKEVEGSRETTRKKRSGSGLKLAALVGYTNAGKSTLLNRMIDTYCPDESRRVFEQDMLFATLDTTVRRISPAGKRDFLLSDTVGFIHDLPHDLVEAFRSTLEEVKRADLLIQVVDCSDENFERHMEVTRETLRELSAGHIPMLYVMNKADRCPEERKLPLIAGDRIYMSAKEGIGIPELLSLIEERLYGRAAVCSFLIPYGTGSAESRLREEAEVLEASYEEDGVRLLCRLPEGMCREPWLSPFFMQEGKKN